MYRIGDTYLCGVLADAEAVAIAEASGMEIHAMLALGIGGMHKRIPRAQPRVLEFRSSHATYAMSILEACRAGVQSHGSVPTTARAPMRSACASRTTCR